MILNVDGDSGAETFVCSSFCVSAVVLGSATAAAALV